jgi:hypothetical protein
MAAHTDMAPGVDAATPASRVGKGCRDGPAENHYDCEK